MQKMKKIIMGLVLAVPLVASAETLSLLQAYQKAQQYDATLRAAIADNNAQKEGIDMAFAAFLPQARISMYEGRNETDSETLGVLGSINKQHRNYDSHNYSFSVRQSIFNKANFAGYSQSKAEFARSSAQLEGEQQSLTSRVVGAYLELLLSAENVAYSQSQKESVESQLGQAKRRFQAGVGTKTEISEAQAQLDTVIAQSLEWSNGMEYAKRALENLTGVYTEAYFSLDAKKLPLLAPQPVGVEEWINLALEKNPAIIAAQNDYVAVSQEIEKNSSGHYPTLDLVASRTRTESDNNYTIGSKYDTDSIGLQLNVPIYSGGYVSAGVRQAVARAEQAREKVSEKQRAVRADVRKYFNEIVNGIARVQAHEQSVQSYETALLGTQKAYAAGMRTNVEVLTAQEKLYSAKRELAKERYKLIYNRIELKHSAGLLKEDDVAEVDGWLLHQ